MSTRNWFRDYMENLWFHFFSIKINERNPQDMALETFEIALRNLARRNKGIPGLLMEFLRTLKCNINILLFGNYFFEGVIRLNEVSASPQLNCFHHFGTLFKVCQHQHRNIFCGFVCLHFLEHLKSVLFGKHKIKEHKIRQRAFDKTDPLFAIKRLSNFIPLSTERFF